MHAEKKWLLELKSLHARLFCMFFVVSFFEDHPFSKNLSAIPSEYETVNLDLDEARHLIALNNDELSNFLGCGVYPQLCGIALPNFFTICSFDI